MGEQHRSPLVPHPVPPRRSILPRSTPSSTGSTRSGVETERVVDIRPCSFFWIHSALLTSESCVKEVRNRARLHLFGGGF